MDDDLDGDPDQADVDCREGFDPTRTETSALGTGPCSDGADNDQDGGMDAQDADCLGYDATRAETSIGPGTCGDGVDNDADGSPDLADLDCLVGNPRMPSGGGNEIALTQMCGLGDAFYGAKGQNFANLLGQEGRRFAFRYAISAQGCGGSGGEGEIRWSPSVGSPGPGLTWIHLSGRNARFFFLRAPRNSGEPAVHSWLAASGGRRQTRCDDERPSSGTLQALRSRAARAGRGALGQHRR